MDSLNLWTVDTWMSRPGLNTSGFSLWVSPRFIEKAQEIMKVMDEPRVQEYARHLIKEAGFTLVTERHSYLKFRPEVGLSNIEVPGNASGLDLDFKSNYERCGYTLLPHNVDGPLQQSTLMVIWMYWAKGVEAHILQETGGFH